MSDFRHRIPDETVDRVTGWPSVVIACNESMALLGHALIGDVEVTVGFDAVFRVELVVVGVEIAVGGLGMSTRLAESATAHAT
jgi:hypothetical protein